LCLSSLTPGRFLFFFVVCCVVRLLYCLLFSDWKNLLAPASFRSFAADAFTSINLN